jgi:hypothetical protein
MARDIPALHIPAIHYNKKESLREPQRLFFIFIPIRVS